MEQIIFKNTLVLGGTIKEVTAQLKILSEQYKTLKDLFKDKFQPT